MSTTTTGPVSGAANGRAVGVATVAGSSLCNQTGAALGALAFGVIGPVGVVAIRQLVTGALLGVLVRPPLRTMTAAQWRPVLGLAVTFGVMNLGLYSAVDRIGLGLAVTLEFLGPLAVAVGSSRRIVDGLAALVAAVGVVVLTAPGPSTDVVGIGAALLAAAAWAGYILLNREVGRRVPGVQGTAAAAVVAAVAWAGPALAWLITHPPTLPALAFALSCALLASVVPFVADLLALRRLPAGVFGTLTSLNPVWAALAGWVVLGQSLGPRETAGIALIVASNVAVTVSGLARARSRCPGCTAAPPIRCRPRSTSRSSCGGDSPMSGTG